MTVSLRRRGSELSSPRAQLRILNQKAGGERGSVVLFEEKLRTFHPSRLQPSSLQTLQINLGKMCNQTCTHCHVDAGPDRKEIMTREVMAHCLRAVEDLEIETVDLTGGAPELNPHFRWFVRQLRSLSRPKNPLKVIVRSNLTILLANKSFADLPDFFKEHRLEVVSSLPCYGKETTDNQRGDGVFDASIEAIRRLNRVGYGNTGSGLTLHLVYNPNGAFLPGPQEELEKEFKRALKERFGVSFNRLFTITNLPISRFLDFLIESGNYENYMATLVAAFNPSTLDGLMCRSMLSIGWDGQLYDCDFNQMLELPIAAKRSRYINEVSAEEILKRSIVTGQHCFGCTAGSGSSCGGALTEG